MHRLANQNNNHLSNTFLIQNLSSYKGNWYLFYHNANKFFHDNPTAKPDDANRWFRRSVCVDYLHYNADGTIQKVIPTKEGVKEIK